MIKLYDEKAMLKCRENTTKNCLRTSSPNDCKLIFENILDCFSVTRRAAALFYPTENDKNYLQHIQYLDKDNELAYPQRIKRCDKICPLSEIEHQKVKKRSHKRSTFRKQKLKR